MRPSTGDFKGRRYASGRFRLHSVVVATVAICLEAPLIRAAEDDAREIVRRAMLLNSEEAKIQKEYTYLERLESRKLDGSGKVTSRDSKMWDITRLDDRRFRRLVQHNDKPLTAREEQEEEARLQKVAAQRRKNLEKQHPGETVEQRKQREAEAKEEERKKDEKTVDDIVNSFDLRLVGEEQVDGMAVWVVEGTPRKGYRFQDKSNSPVGKIKGRIWVSKADYQPVKIDAETIDTIAIGGVLARVQKGAHIHVEYTRVNGEVWLPKRMSFTVSARLLLVKGLHEEQEQTFRNYKKFTAESKLVE